MYRKELMRKNRMLNTTVKFNGREYKVTEIIPSDPKCEALCADLVKRGFETQLYVLTGKRGGTVVCLRSAKSGKFEKLY